MGILKRKKDKDEKKVNQNFTYDSLLVNNGKMVFVVRIFFTCFIAGIALVFCGIYFAPNQPSIMWVGISVVIFSIVCLVAYIFITGRSSKGINKVQQEEYKRIIEEAKKNVEEHDEIEYQKYIKKKNKITKENKELQS